METTVAEALEIRGIIEENEKLKADLVAAQKVIAEKHRLLMGGAASLKDVHLLQEELAATREEIATLLEEREKARDERDQAREKVEQLKGEIQKGLCPYHDMGSEFTDDCTCP